PSLRHSSVPFSPSFAGKNNKFLTATSGVGAPGRKNSTELPAPGLMSRTSAVPKGEPSLAHSSLPLTPSLAKKNSRGPATVRPIGFDDPSPGRMSLTSIVPSGVPSLFHSSLPTPAPPATKYRLPAKLVSDAGDEGPPL